MSHENHIFNSETVTGEHNIGINTDLVKSLKNLLADVQELADPEFFTGTGVIVYSSLDGLSLVPMGHTPRVPALSDIARQIIEASNLRDPNHDGFHLIDSERKLTHLNQYISPNVPDGFQLSDFHRERSGARLITAVLASLAPAVICSGVISKEYGIITFKDGGQV